MRRLIVGLTVIFLLLASFTFAEEYTVKGGDYLSKIGKQSGVAWRGIAKANNLKPPYVIFPGQKLQIPGAGNAQPIFNKVAAAVTEESPYLAIIRELKAKVAEMEEKLNQKIASEQLIKQEAAAQAAAKEQKVVVATPTVVEGKVLTEIGGKVEQAKATPESQNILPATSVATMVKKSQIDGDQFDAFMSVGGWTSTGNKDSANGSYGQAKVRYRPVTFNAFNHEVGMGGFLLGETGSGSTGKYNFNWNKFGIGPSAKVYGEHWDATTDLGWTRQWDFGGSDKQITDSVYFLQYLNLEQRRAAQKKWLPQTEFVFSATAPFSAYKESTKGKTMGKEMTADNKGSFGFDIKQSIYDAQISEHIRITPGVLVGAGYEATNGYGKIGPFVKLGAYNQDILTLESSIKSKSSVDGVRWYGALMLHVGGVKKALKSAGITQPATADLTVNK